MRSFILKILLISLIVLIIFSSMNFLFANSWYYSNALIDWHPFENVPYGIDILNIGNSHGLRGFNYTDYENCWNFAVQGQTFDYDIRILKQYSDHINDGGYMFIPISYLSFARMDDAQKKKQELRYYRILRPEYIKDFSLSDYIMYKWFPLLTVDNEIIEAIKQEIQKGRRENLKLSDYPEKAIEFAIIGYKDRYFSNYSYDETQLEALCQIIEFALQKGMTPVLLTVPVPDIYTELNTLEMAADFSKSIDFITSKYNLEYHDYSSHPDFFTNYALFKDCSHMNKTGGIMFTEMVFSDLGISSR